MPSKRLPQPTLACVVSIISKGSLLEVLGFWNEGQGQCLRGQNEEFSRLLIDGKLKQILERVCAVPGRKELADKGSFFGQLYDALTTSVGHIDVLRLGRSENGGGVL